MRQKLWRTALFLMAMPLLVIAGAALAAPGDNAASPRQRLLMDFGWRFINGDPADVGSTLDYQEGGRLDKATVSEIAAENLRAAARPDPVATNLGGQLSYVQPGFDDSAWRVLDVPHDWAVELGYSRTPHTNLDSPTVGRFHQSHGFRDMDASKGTNIGWYRKTFTLPASDAGKTLRVEFDGVYRNSLVWLNGQCLGRYPSGYSSFSYDITKQAKPGEKNTLVVRVDATKWEGWFYEGAGIYRHVWLVKTNPVHVAHWGTFVTTTVTGNDAAATVQTQVRNDGTQSVAASLISTVVDSAGKTVAESPPSPVTLEAGMEKTITQQVPVRAAKLWSLETPTLYRMVSTIKTGSAVADRYETPFGIRTLKWDPNLGFFLNGKHVVIQGTANHQDHAGVGSALPDRLNVYRIEQLKKMGCNAYRCAHNPPTPELLDACDKLGLLVLDETRRMDTTAWAVEQLQAMVRRDRNHPSIFLWGIGNEEMGLQGTAAGAQIAKTLQDQVHALDPTRLATVAMNGAWGTGFTTVIDVQGYNYLKQGSMDQTHQQFPDKPSIGTEEASTMTTRGEYATTRTGFESAYDVNVPNWGSTAEAWMQYYAARPYLAGAFVWTGFDYRGEPAPFGWPNISSPMGFMDLCGFPKDTYYFYKAWWTNQPVLHLLPHWNWPGKEGQPIDVWAYGNCEEVELSLNGKSLGRQKMEKMSHVSWQVPYAPGTLTARGFTGGRQVSTDTVETAGAPASVTLSPDRATIHADGEDVSVVTVSVVDAQGRVVPLADNEIIFAIQGGKILGVGNGDPTSHEPDKAEQRMVFHGLAQVIVQAPKQGGLILLTATAAGLKTGMVTLTAQPAPLRPAVP